MQENQGQEQQPIKPYEELQQGLNKHITIVNLGISEALGKLSAIKGSVPDDVFADLAMSLSKASGSIAAIAGWQGYVTAHPGAWGEFTGAGGDKPISDRAKQALLGTISQVQRNLEQAHQAATGRTAAQPALPLDELTLLVSGIIKDSAIIRHQAHLKGTVVQMYENILDVKKPKQIRKVPTGYFSDGKQFKFLTSSAIIFIDGRDWSAGLAHAPYVYLVSNDSESDAVTDITSNTHLSSNVVVMVTNALKNYINQLTGK